MKFYGLDVRQVLQAYVDAALWSSTDDDSNPLDQNYDENELSFEFVSKSIADILKFIRVAHEELKTWCGPNTTIEEQTGHDLWLNRNGHGVGFWEKEWGEVGPKLDEIARSFGEVTLYVGDDGFVYSHEE